MPIPTPAPRQANPTRPTFVPLGGGRRADEVIRAIMLEDSLYFCMDYGLVDELQSNPTRPTFVPLAAGGGRRVRDMGETIAQRPQGGTGRRRLKR